MGVECILCFSEYTDGGERQPACYPCGHVFCWTCISSLHEPSCPSCRWDAHHDIQGHATTIVRKLFVPQLCDDPELPSDLTRPQEIAITPEPETQRVSITATQREAAAEIANRLKDLGVELDGREQEVQETLDQAGTWIAGIDSIENVEVKVALTRLLFETSCLNRKLKYNTTLSDRASKAEREVVSLRVLKSAVQETLKIERRMRKDLEAEFEETLFGVRSELDEEVSFRQNLQKKLSVKREAVGRLEAELRFATCDLAGTAKKYQETAQALEEVKLTNRNLQSKLDHMRDNYNSEQARTSEYVEEVKKLQYRNSKLEDELDESDKHFAKVLARKKLLKAQAEAAERFAEASKASLISTRKKADQSREELEIAKEATSKLRAELQQLRTNGHVSRRSGLEAVRVGGTLRYSESLPHGMPSDDVADRDDGEDSDDHGGTPGPSRVRTAAFDALGAPPLKRKRGSAAHRREDEDDGIEILAVSYPGKRRRPF